MTPKFHEEWRTLDPEAPAPESTARFYDNRADAVDDEFRFPWRIAQKRLVSYWEDDQ